MRHTVGLLLAIFLSAIIMTAVPPAEGKRVWDACPLAPGGKPVPLPLQHEAWNKAKYLTHVEGIEKWDLPCRVSRFDYEFKGDPDGDGPLRDSEYLGFYHPPPGPTFLYATGAVILCESIELYVAPENEDMVKDVLVHEYLHALFYRFWHMAPGFREVFKPEDSERWVREITEQK